MNYERDEAMRLQEAREAMIRMRESRVEPTQTYPDYVHELAEAQAHIQRLSASLRNFLCDDQFQVAVGGNPNVVDAMLARAREALAKAESWL